MKQLLRLDQGHLFADWPPPGIALLYLTPCGWLLCFHAHCTDGLHHAGQADDQKQKLMQQLTHLDASYNGGLAAYIENAKKLLQDSREGWHFPMLWSLQSSPLCLLLQP